MGVACVNPLHKKNSLPGSRNKIMSKVQGSSFRPRSRCEVRIGSLNVGTMERKALEVVEMMQRRRLEVLCVQEMKWKGDKARQMAGGYKMMHAGGHGRSNGVGVIVSEEISREVERVERLNGRAIAVWMIVEKQLMCVISVYGPQTGRTEAEKQDCRDKVEKMMGLVEVGTMLCVAVDFNAHVAETGDEESIGRYGWGTRTREGQDLVEMVMGNGMVVAGSFFQKGDSHKVTYRSGNHKTELDLLVVRRQQLCRIKYCKAIAGEYVTTQHKPVVFIVRMQKTRKSRMQGRKTIKCWKCAEGMIDEYKERVKIKYEELDA